MTADDFTNFDPAPTRAPSPGGVATTGPKTAVGNRGDRSAGAGNNAPSPSPAAQSSARRRRTEHQDPTPEGVGGTPTALGRGVRVAARGLIGGWR